MYYLASPDRRYRLAQLREERSIEHDFIPGHMNDDDAERQRLEIVLVLESAVGGDEHFTRQLLYLHVVFQMLPTEIKKGSDGMFRKCFYDARIDAGVTTRMPVD
jgi:hypothetical protein